MSLVQTPILKQKIESISNDFMSKVWSGSGFNKDNFESRPAELQQEACQQFASDLSAAFENWLENTVFITDPGSLATAGSPFSHVNVSPGHITKI